MLGGLQRRLRESSTGEGRSTALENCTELWEVCHEIGSEGITSAPEDVEEDVEPHYVCFAALGENLGLFDGDRPPGLWDLDIKFEDQGLLPQKALGAVKEHLETHASEKRDYSTLLAFVWSPT